MLGMPKVSLKSTTARTERLLYFALPGLLEACRLRTMKDAMTVLRQASGPPGQMATK